MRSLARRRSCERDCDRDPREPRRRVAGAECVPDPRRLRLPRAGDANPEPLGRRDADSEDSGPSPAAALNEPARRLRRRARDRSLARAARRAAATAARDTGTRSSCSTAAATCSSGPGRAKSPVAPTKPAAAPNAVSSPPRPAPPVPGGAAELQPGVSGADEAGKPGDAPPAPALAIACGTAAGGGRNSTVNVVLEHGGSVPVSGRIRKTGRCACCCCCPDSWRVCGDTAAASALAPASASATIAESIRPSQPLKALVVRQRACA